MTKRMLIDAAHAEETRVVVVDGTRIDEFDFESRSRKQLRGNIYLAKVTRVEPSLQAAFVEYGGNRHGFLAFNEIHPDYYQIPIADREALLREEAEEEEEHERGQRNSRDRDRTSAAEGEDAAESIDDDDDVIEEELERRRRRLMRRYKIQEVIKRRQIMLVQVVKEERGNKGAALTTYLSLAGRYCVLMPNTARGGGISRKITNAADRKRLKSAAQSLDVPHGMGLIIRTAGAARTKAEIKRDYEYLLRLWETIREATLKSIAPALIYEEEDLVKRAIRDMYDKDLDGILVEGEAGYREARDFMRMIMPSQAKKIIHYKEAIPLFVKHRVEDQLAAIHSPTVPLRSGGYLVINQTEALVAVDVNSGRATRERNIEATALKTNMEAAEEASRQLRLRDLAGLVVIDFIDMDESKNNRAVEKKLKDCLKDDRARVQMGKISSFGLMEISRQRRRSGVLEGTTHICEHCQGSGRVRSTESAALSALRAIEIEAAKGGAGAITVRLCPAVGLYVLNEKRAYLSRLEHAQGLIVTVAIDEALGVADFTIDRTATHEGRPPTAYAETPLALPDPADFDVPEDEDEEEDETEAEDEDEIEADGGGGRAREAAGGAEAGETDADGQRRRGRRRRRRGGRGGAEGERDRGGRSAEGGGVAVARAEGEEDDEGDEDEDGAAVGGPDAGSEIGPDGVRRRRRRRGRRGGRRMREEGRDADPYAWVAPPGGRDEAAPGDDAYAWRDPHGRGRNPAPAAAPVQTAAGDGAPAEPAGEPRRDREGRRDRGRGRGRDRGPRPPESDAYAWSEPVEAAPQPAAEAPAAEVVTPEPVAEAAAPAKRVRASRAKTPKPAETADAVAAVEAPAAPAEAPAPKARASRSRKAAVAPEPAAEIVGTVEVPALEPEPVRVLEPAMAEPAPREPDPAEITTPPPAPRRGWWRR